MELCTNAPLSPLFILAPTARCGITLLQRLLNSSREIIIYGENKLPTNWIPQALLDVSAAAEAHNRARKKLLDGSYDFWSSAAWPDTRQWSQALVEALELLLRTCQRCAAEDGFSRWGIKNPLDDAKSCAVLYNVLPHARFIFLYRHIVDVMRSYKGRKWLGSAQTCIEVAARWVRNVSYMLTGQIPDRILLIRYEDMLASPDEWTDRLEQFAGVSGIDRTIFQRKINTFAGKEENGHSPDQYIAPQPLSAQELAIIRQLAGNMLRQCGYPSVDDVLDPAEQPQEQTATVN